MTDLSMHKLFAGMSAVIVAIALVWGFVLAGSPVTSRQERFDERRVSDLQVIHNTILEIVYEGRQWEPPADGSLRRPLPATLDAVAEQATYQRVNLLDPQTGEPYGYEVTGETTYELCATFASTRDNPYEVFWNHGPGRTCFRFDALRASGYAGERVMVPRPVK